MTIEKKPIIANRLRKITGSFSFIPHAFVTQRFFSSLNQHELLLYFLLVLVTRVILLQPRPALYDAENEPG